MSVARRRFRFIKEIAEGGFGKVYLAEQMSTDGFSRIVAVKLLHAKWSSHDEIVMRTRDEARLLGLIRHQHIVKVEDLTSIDGKCAIVMEYLEGDDLKNLMGFLREKGEIFPRAALFEIMLGVVSALDAAYNGLPLQGGEPLRVIHRDIKPSNIFVTVPGAVKVLDFGTARANFAEREAKTQALAFGSQGYMSPERMLGEEDTPAADVFSLGVTLYELLTFESFGRIPPRPNKFLAKVQERVAAIPLTGDPEWQQQVRDTVRRMLCYDPKERPSSAELVDVFEVLMQNAKDTPLRKFCRVTVAEAKAAEPEVQNGDPLTGQVVDEDLSSAFGVGQAGVPSLPGGVLNDSAGDVSAPKQRPGTMSSAAHIPAQKPLRSSGGSGPAIVSVDDPPAGGGSKMMIIGAVVLVLLLLGGGGALAVALGGAAWFASGETVDVPKPDVPTPDVPKPDVPKPDVPKPDVPAAGGKITSNEQSKDEPSSLTVLKALATPGDVKITGTKFKAEWDGKSDFDLGTINEGTYRANLSIGGNTVRTTFKVEAHKGCEFSFDAAAAGWTGGCK